MNYIITRLVKKFDKGFQISTYMTLNSFRSAISKYHFKRLKSVAKHPVFGPLLTVIFNERLRSLDMCLYVMWSLAAYYYSLV